MSKKRIYVVFKTHFDIGFTELSEEVIRQYGQKMLPDVIKTCEETKKLGPGRKYIWSMPGWPLKKSMEEGSASEETVKTAKQLLREGQIAWLGFPFTTHTEYCGIEELIRGFDFSADLSREYGYWPISAKMTDVPGHTCVLPTLLAGAGIRFLHLGCNPGCTAPDVPRLFWWEGPDGSRVLTFYSKGCYGTNPIPPEDWAYDAWLALMQTNDNIGPQDGSIVEEIEAQVRRELPDAEVKVTTLDAFYEDIIHCGLDIPVISMDLADSWIHGVGTYPRETAQNRRTRREIKEAESLLTALEVWGNGSGSDFAPAVSDVYENLLLFGEHTWGLDVKTHMGGFRHYEKESFLAARDSEIYRKMEKSWDEQRRRATIAHEKTQELLQKGSAALCEQLPSDGGRIVVFLHSGQTDSCWVTVPEGEGGLIDTRTGASLPIRHTSDGRQVFLTDPPAFGYVTLRATEQMSPTPPALHTEENDYEILLENQFYRIQADKQNGLLTSLFDKTTRKEWIDPACSDGFAGYRYDRYGIEDLTEFERAYTYRFYDWLVNDLGRINYPQCGHETYRPVFREMTVTNNGQEAILTIRQNGAEKSVARYGDTKEIVTEIILRSEDEKIDIRFHLRGKEETSFIEAIHFVFPFRLSRARIRINKAGSLVDPATDIIKNANHVLYCLEDYICLTDGENGMAVVSHDIPLVSVGDEHIYQFREVYREEKLWLYFNAWNNQWGTNFPQWTEGDFDFSFTLFPFRGEAAENASHRARRAASPICGYATGPSKGTLAENAAWIELSARVGISAFMPSRYYSGAYLLRLREYEGSRKDLRIRIAGLTRVEKCDFQERPTQSLTVEGEEFADTIQAYGYCSYLLRFDGE